MLIAGTSCVDITPPPGSLMSCFPMGRERRPRRALGAHDPLLARVLCLSDGGRPVAVCACDLTAISAPDVTCIRDAVAEPVPDLAGRRVLVAASHTHHSAETTYRFGNTPGDPWIAEMNCRMAAAVIEAHSGMRPVRLSVAAIDTGLAHNRRVCESGGGVGLAFDFREGVTTGVSDSEVLVFRFTGEDDEPVAVVFNFAAHGLTVGPQNLLYTADFPGVACAALERRFPGARALFLNGAAGNQHPRKSMRAGFETMREVGEELAEAVVAAGARAREVSPPRVELASETLNFPNRMDPSLCVEAEVAVLRLGPVAVGFVPGEFFVEFQREFKAALAPRPAGLVAYANGAPGYVPTREACAAGGYGCDPFEGDPPELSRTSLPVGAGESMLARVVDMARTELKRAK